MITRRQFLKWLVALTAGGAALGGYAVGVEPLLRLEVRRYRVRPKRWVTGLRLKIAVIADIHACRPWMPVESIRAIVAKANALKPDLTVLLGDYGAGHPFVTGTIANSKRAEALAGLSAPLGVRAIIGNHDWWEDSRAQRRGHGPTAAQVALEESGIGVLENRAERFSKGGKAFWLAGLGDQIALYPSRKFGRRTYQGVDDLAGTLGQVTDQAPVILLAHEPDIFASVPERVSLTLSGHTHGGQVRLFGYAPYVPSAYGNRYAYGHVVERGRHLVVSGGLGCSVLPLRFGVPPEIVMLDIGASS